MTEDEYYMQRALQIAKNAFGTTWPNPMVGALLVCKDKIIGEGYTSAYGGSHAEINAIASVKDKTLLPISTLYVTLEPCAHQGKTPPCTTAIITHEIPKVIIGVLDPNDKVTGKGVSKLRAAGVTVQSGILEEQCRMHHRRFLTFCTKKRPYIILKWAKSEDGFLAPARENRSKVATPYWITNRYSRQLVHQWRAEEQGILVGYNTVYLDNPRLTIREWSGKSPTRVVIDPQKQLPKTYNVFGQSATTLVMNEVKDDQSEKNITYIKCNLQTDIAENITTVLYKKNMLSLLVEGGKATLQHFIDANLWDEARIFTGDKTLKNGLQAPIISGHLAGITSIDNDTLELRFND